MTEENIQAHLNDCSQHSSKFICRECGMVSEHFLVAKKMAVMAEKTPISPSPFPKGNAMTLPVAAPEVNIEAEAVPEEQIIYIDDDIDPSPLSLLERQVDHLLMPPLTDTTPIVQRASMSPRRDQQPPRCWRGEDVHTVLLARKCFRKEEKESP